MRKLRILWADDEIDLLKPHVLFLQEKGFEVITTNNGDEALDMIEEENFDIVFLDENMPGISGLETLSRLRVSYPNLPVVMITKNDQEVAMDEAIGSNTSDYLIKPVNPNQILLSLKKNLENKRLVSEKTSQAYQREFRSISLNLSSRMKSDEWIEVFRKMVYWELELQKSYDAGMNEALLAQKKEANIAFCKYYESNYLSWLSGASDDIPIMSHTLMAEEIMPRLYDEGPFFIILIDNLRYDQWKTIQPVLEEYYRVQDDDIYYCMVPSTTQYARNALFSGLLPSEIEKQYPDYWTQESDEGTKNQFEQELFGAFLKRNGHDLRYDYEKILTHYAGKKYVDNLQKIVGKKLNILVYNFVDMLSHARTEMNVIRELADDEPAYRSLTLSWFKHSPLFEVLQFLAERKVNVIITTDHGSVKVENPIRITGDKNVNSNLRYKFGKVLDYNKKDVFEVRNPKDAFLPQLTVSNPYVFCRTDGFFTYPNNYTQHVNHYKNTFQHGGISMEEILIPFIYLKSK